MDSKEFVETKDMSSSRARQTLVILTAIISFFYAGSFFGFGPMQLLLEGDGAFSSQCDNSLSDSVSDEVVVCKAQSSSLVTVQFLAAAVSQSCSPILGIISDKYGPKVLMIFLSVCGCLGVSCLILASLLNIDTLLYVAFTLNGLVSMSIVIMILKIGMLFPCEQKKNRVISCLNTLYDAGMITNLGLWAFQRSVGIPYTVLLGLYLMGGVVIYVGAIYCWSALSRNGEPDSLLKSSSTKIPAGYEDLEVQMLGDDDIDDCLVNSFESHDDTTNDNTHQKIELVSSLDSQDSFDDENDIEAMNSDTTTPMKQKSEKEQTSPSERTEATFLSEGSLDASLSDSDDDDTDDDSLSAHMDIQPKSLPRCNIPYIKIASRSRKDQFKNPNYLLIVAFFSIHFSRYQFTITTSKDFLRFLGDDNTYQAILYLFALVALIGLPFVDYLLRVHGFHAALHTVNAVALLHGLIVVSSTNLNVQIIGFFLLSMSSCLIYSVTFSFLGTFFGESMIGNLAGMLMFVSSIVSLINIPLASTAMNALGGDFFYPNLGYTIAVLPCIFIARQIGKGIHNEL